MKERGGDVIVKVIEDRYKDIILPLIEDNVTKGATVMTDEFNGYSSLYKRYSHNTISHKEKKYVNGACHTNGIENFWSQLKIGITGTYRAVSVKHLQRYCNEFSTRQNLKGIGNINIFSVLINMTDVNRIRYTQLTAQ